MRPKGIGFRIQGIQKGIKWLLGVFGGWPWLLVGVAALVGLIVLAIYVRRVGTLLLLALGTVLLAAGLVLVAMEGLVSLTRNNLPLSTESLADRTKSWTDKWPWIIAPAIAFLVLASFRIGDLLGPSRSYFEPQENPLVRQSTPVPFQTSGIVIQTPPPQAGTSSPFRPVAVKPAALVIKTRYPLQPGTPVAESTPDSPTPTTTQPPSNLSGTLSPQLQSVLKLTIAEIHADPNPDQEYVSIINLGVDTDLMGSSLKKEEGPALVFPSFVLRSLGEVTVYTGRSDGTKNSLGWNLEHSIWSEPGEALLMDSAGIVIDRVVVRGH